MVRYRPVSMFCLAFGWGLFWGSLEAAELEIPPEPAPVIESEEAEDEASEDASARDADPGSSAEKVIEIEVVKERYPNRAIKIERQVSRDKDGNFINFGSWSKWDPQGVLLGRGEYWNGKRHGEWTRWFIDGEEMVISDDAEPVDEPFAGPQYSDFEKPFISKATFSEGKMFGEWTVVDRRDRMIRSLHVEDSRPHGKATWWYTDGNKRREITYKHGVVDGEWLEWGPDGELIREDTYVDGRKLAPYTKRYPSGEKFAEGSVLHAREFTAAEADWWNGAVKCDVIPEDEAGENAKHGKWTYWHPTGGKEHEGNFVADRPIGLHIRWYPNGQKESQGEFVDGKAHGPWIWWHSNGQMYMEGAFVRGGRIGTWTRWQEDGTVARVREHSPDSMADDTAPLQPTAEPPRQATTPQTRPATMRRSVNPLQRLFRRR